MKIQNLIVITLIVVILSWILYLVPEFQKTGKTIQNTQTKTITENIKITKENLPEFLENQKIVKELPKNSKISLKLYNFDNGEREIEQEYTITKGKVLKKNAENPDIEVIIHSKYLQDMKNLCNTIKNAKTNNDFAAWTEMNTMKFLWKYKSMMKYRDCFDV